MSSSPLKVDTNNCDSSPAIRSGCFDAVTSHQVLEHVSDPAAALAEMTRVLRPGGWLIVVGPNLIGLSISVLAFLYSLPRTRPVRYWFTPEPGFPTFPFGTTYPQVVHTFFKNLWRLAQKHYYSEPQFIMRVPDLTEPAGADSDSCYLLNPIDLVKYLQPRGFEIVSRRGDGRLGFLGSLGGGTWIAARRVR
jgi:SAM-dependent methyltransferase